MRAILAATICGVLALTACNDDSKDKASSAAPSASSVSSASSPSSPPSAPPASSAPAPAPATSASVASPPPSAPASSAPSAPAGPTTAAALQRYETFLHALGREDLSPVCEIAAPAAKKAQDEGMGDCKTSFTGMFSLISPTQKKALQTATIDPAKVVAKGSAKVEVPASAVKASVTFTSGDLGDITLEFMNGNWFITD